MTGEREVLTKRSCGSEGARAFLRTHSQGGTRCAGAGPRAQVQVTASRQPSELAHVRLFTQASAFRCLSPTCPAGPCRDPHLLLPLTGRALGSGVSGPSSADAAPVAVQWVSEGVQEPVGATTCSVTFRTCSHMAPWGGPTACWGGVAGEARGNEKDKQGQVGPAGEAASLSKPGVRYGSVAGAIPWSSDTHTPRDTGGHRPPPGPRRSPQLGECAQCLRPPEPRALSPYLTCT